MTAGKVDVTIRLETDATPERVDDIVRELSARGLERVEAHPQFRLVNGTIDAELVDTLRTVGGVESVRRDRTYGPQEE